MTETENEQQNESRQSGGHGARTAAKAAAAAAATSVAAIAVRKVMSSGSSSNGQTGEGENGAPKSGSRGSSSGSLFSSIASGGWDAAHDALLPLAEDAAGAAGAYLAKNGPDVLRETIVPKFISAFNESRNDG